MRLHDLLKAKLYLPHLVGDPPVLFTSQTGTSNRDVLGITTLEFLVLMVALISGSPAGL